MKTITEINQFLSIWKTLTQADRAKIDEFLGLIELSTENSPKIPQVQNLPSDFLTWMNSNHTPARFERIYYTDGLNVCVGIIMNVNRRTGEITLYCEFNYKTKELNLNRPIINMGYNIRLCTESEYKRLKSELNKIGLVWKDKIHRLEPLEVKCKVGSQYFYLDTDLSIRSDVEKNTKKSHLRYIAGNYFSDYGKALEACDRVREVLKEVIFSQNLDL